MNKSTSCDDTKPEISSGALPAIIIITLHSPFEKSFFSKV